MAQTSSSAPPDLKGKRRATDKMFAKWKEENEIGNSAGLSIAFEREQRLPSTGLSPRFASPSSLHTSPRLGIPKGECLDLKRWVDNEVYLADAPSSSTILPTPSLRGVGANPGQHDLELEFTLGDLNFGLNYIPDPPSASSPRLEQRSQLHAPRPVASDGDKARNNENNRCFNLTLNDVSDPLTPLLRSKQSSHIHTTPPPASPYDYNRIQGRDLGLESKLDNLNLGLSNFPNPPPRKRRPTQSNHSHVNVKGYTRKPYERPTREQRSSYLPKGSFYGSFMNPDRLLALALKDLQPGAISTLRTTKSPLLKLTPKPKRTCREPLFEVPLPLIESELFKIPIETPDQVIDPNSKEVLDFIASAIATVSTPGIPTLRLPTPPPELAAAHTTPPNSNGVSNVLFPQVKSSLPTSASSSMEIDPVGFTCPSAPTTPYHPKFTNISPTPNYISPPPASDPFSSALSVASYCDGNASPFSGFQGIEVLGQSGISYEDFNGQPLSRSSLLEHWGKTHQVPTLNAVLGTLDESTQDSPSCLSQDLNDLGTCNRAQHLYLTQLTETDLDETMEQTNPTPWSIEEDPIFPQDFDVDMLDQTDEPPQQNSTSSIPPAVHTLDASRKPLSLDQAEEVVKFKPEKYIKSPSVMSPSAESAPEPRLTMHNIIRENLEIKVLRVPEESKLASMTQSTDADFSLNVEAPLAEADSTLNAPTRANIKENGLVLEGSTGQNDQLTQPATQPYKFSSRGQCLNLGPVSTESRCSVDVDKAVLPRQWVDVVCDIYNATSRVENVTQYTQIQQEGSVPTRRELKWRHSILRSTLKTPLKMGGLEQHTETPPIFHRCAPCEEANSRTKGAKVKTEKGARRKARQEGERQERRAHKSLVRMFPAGNVPEPARSTFLVNHQAQPRVRENMKATFPSPFSK